MNKLIGLAILAFICCGCVYEVRQNKISNVTQIMFVSESYYHVFCTDPISKEVTVRTIAGDIKVFADVSQHEPMWIDEETGFNNKYIFHIHSTDSISGGETGGKHSSPIRPIIPRNSDD